MKTLSQTLNEAIGHGIMVDLIFKDFIKFIFFKNINDTSTYTQLINDKKNKYVVDSIKKVFELSSDIDIINFFNANEDKTVDITQMDNISNVLNITIDKHTYEYLCLSDPFITERLLAFLIHKQRIDKKLNKDNHYLSLTEFPKTRDEKWKYLAINMKTKKFDDGINANFSLNIKGVQENRFAKYIESKMSYPFIASVYNTNKAFMTFVTIEKIYSTGKEFINKEGDTFFQKHRKENMIIDTLKSNGISVHDINDCIDLFTNGKYKDTPVAIYKSRLLKDRFALVIKVDGSTDYGSNYIIPIKDTSGIRIS